MVVEKIDGVPGGEPKGKDAQCRQRKMDVRLLGGQAVKGYQHAGRGRESQTPNEFLEFPWRITIALLNQASLLEVQFLAQDACNYCRLFSVKTGVKGGEKRAGEILFSIVDTFSIFNVSIDNQGIECLALIINDHRIEI